MPRNGAGTAGKIFSARVQNGELILMELADFNTRKLGPVEAPQRAKHWHG